MNIKKFGHFGQIVITFTLLQHTSKKTILLNLRLKCIFLFKLDFLWIAKSVEGLILVLQKKLWGSIIFYVRFLLEGWSYPPTQIESI